MGTLKAPTKCFKNVWNWYNICFPDMYWYKSSCMVWATKITIHFRKQFGVWTMFIQCYHTYVKEFQIIICYGIMCFMVHFYWRVLKNLFKRWSDDQYIHYVIGWIGLRDTAENKNLINNSITSKIWMKLMPRNRETEPPRLDKNVQIVNSGSSETSATSMLP